MTMRTLQKACKSYLAKTQFLFHCHFKIKIPCQYGEILLDECFDLLDTIDCNYNSYRQGSYFHRINQNAGQWVPIDEDCFFILRKTLLVSECTGGAYNIGCTPLLRLWGFYRTDHRHIPSDNDIKKLLAKIDYRSIELEGERVRISADQELITGSFIKSFAVDRLVDFLKSKGVSDAVINAGGSTIFGINDSKHKSWKVNIPGLDHLNIASHQTVIRNQCFSLSARSNQPILVRGREYGHILDSSTGYPASTLQVGVWSDKAFLGDVLSTAIFCVGQNKLENTLERLRSEFRFDYYRIEENGTKTTNLCF
ncbi:MAG: FAD:protein FMN transferase [Bergeyella sp.]|nr:FAD:protein FMN transferase [Bergeyella sp.]